MRKDELLLTTLLPSANERPPRDADARPTPPSPRGPTTTLDVVDPPTWPPAPPDATALVRRVHALRTVPLADLTVEDLRLLISQDVARSTLVPLALDRLRREPLLEGDHYPGDLLHAVLQVSDAHWRAHSDQLALLRESLAHLDRGDPSYQALGDEELARAVARFTEA